MGLLEREHDLAALRSRWERARAGHGGMSLVTGESGAGKSTLLRAVADGIADDVPVVWGACDPLEPPRPLGPLRDVAAVLGDPVRAVLAEAEQPHEVFDAVYRHLRDTPTVLVVDDLHWADQGTIDLLRYLLRRLANTRSLVVGAARADEVGPAHPLRALLGDVARSPDASTRVLRPLTIDAIRALAAGPGLDAPWVLALTGGNPFFVAEIVEHATRTARPDAAGRVDVPVTLRDAVLARTVGLDDTAWDVLHLLTCAPEAIPDRLLPSLGVGLPALRALDEAGLTRRTERGVTFRHDLCRIAIDGSLPPGGEAAFHRRMLDALAGLPGTDPAVLLHHALRAGDADRVLRHGRDAGRLATRSGAHTQAAEFFRAALEHGTTTSDAQRAELLELLAEECYLADRLAEAIAASDEAIELRRGRDDAAGVSANHHALSVYHWYNADRASAEQHASEAAATFAGQDVERPEQLVRLGHAFLMQAYLAIHRSEIARAIGLIDRAADVSARVVDRMLAVRVRLLRAICQVIMDGDDGGRDEILTILSEAGDEFDEVYSGGYSNLSYLDVEHRRLREADAVLQAGLPLAIERDMPICRAWQLGARGRRHLLGGDWDAALDDVGDVLAAPTAPLTRTWPHVVRGLVALRREAGGEEDLEDAWRLACRFGEPIRLLPAAAALAEQAWLTGRGLERLGTLRALLDLPGDGLAWGRGELALWLRRIDGTTTASDVAEPYRLQLAGEHRAAVAIWQRLDAGYERALASIDTEAPDDVRAGLDELDRLGADAVAADVRRRLRERGVAVVPAPRRASTLANPVGLTARQVEVLRLLDTGMTNVELADHLYLSRKTVDHHVSAILTKLQVPNRREAVRQARRLGLVD